MFRIELRLGFVGGFEKRLPATAAD